MSSGQHQLRQVVRASTETSAFRQQQNNVKSQKSTGGRTDATGLHKGALTEYCQCQCHARPYTRILAHRSRCVNTLEAIHCNHWTLKKVARSRMRVNLNTVSSLQLAVSNLLFCLEFHWVGDKHSKFSVIHTRLSSDYKASFFNAQHWHCMWKICSHRPTNNSN